MTYFVSSWTLKLDPINQSMNIPVPANAENTVKLITSIQDRMKEFKAS